MYEFLPLGVKYESRKPNMQVSTLNHTFWVGYMIWAYTIKRRKPIPIFPCDKRT